MKVRQHRRLLLILLLAIVLVRPLAAQGAPTTVRVRLENEVGRAVAGALVALLDGSGKTVVEGLSSVRGERTLTAPAGTYRVRVRRIGYTPYLSAPVTLPHAGDLVLVVQSKPVLLDRVMVTAKSGCKRLGPDVEGVVTVWEEVEKALRASQLTAEDLKGLGRARRYQEHVTSEGWVLDVDIDEFPLTTHRPFGAIDPDTLASLGYVRGDGVGGWDYYGPDETVLLSSGFRNGHCFRLRRDAKRPGTLGIAFEPAGRGFPDIAGVLWLDEATSELRELEFSFVRTGDFSPFDGKGVTRFLRTASGAWMVGEWWMRSNRLRPRWNSVKAFDVIGHVEHGGGILHDDEVALAAPVSTLRGVVYDSTTRKPLAGATIVLGDRHTASDSVGRFALTDVTPGRHSVLFTHPSMSTVGVLGRRVDVDVKADTTSAVLSLPSHEGHFERICGFRRARRDSSGVLHGTVRTRFGTPVPRARVTIRYAWTLAWARTEGLRHKLEVVADNDGHYSACTFDRRFVGKIVAGRDADTSVARDLAFGEAGIIRRDLVLPQDPRPDSAWREVVAIVTDATTGLPLADATVVVEGSKLRARTDDTGRVTLSLGEGIHTVTARRIGYGATTVQMAATPGAEIDLALMRAP